MKKIQKVLPQALDDELIRLGMAQTTLKRWEEVVGSVLAGRSWPDRYDHGVVWVAVQGSAWAQELRLMKTIILGKLCALSGQPKLFTDVRFGVRSLPKREETASTEEQDEPMEGSKELSIGDIAQRRMARWRDAETN